MSGGLLTPELQHIPERSRDFMNAFSRLSCGSGDLHPLERILLLPAPRFYVSEEDAVRIVSAMSRHKRAHIRSHLKYLMFRCLCQRSLRIQALRQIPLSAAVRAAIYSPAPSFFISMRTAQRILRQHTLSRKKGGAK